jgi:hypothetical protein
MSRIKTLVVSIDTEVDSNPSWRISNPPRFSSVVSGIPNVLAPLFHRFGVVPTYLLSPEVIEDQACVETLLKQSRAELGTHLHADFVEPERRLSLETMGGQTNSSLQGEFSREVELAKLRNLTELFQNAFGRAPTSFRSGRYGLTPHTLEGLADLGYKVDSSVTPGLIWDYSSGALDYREWSVGQRLVQTPAGPIVELPLSIMPASPLAPIVRDLPRLPRAVFGKLLRPFSQFRWLRPSWHSGAELIRYCELSNEDILVMMFHSVEVVEGGSPYSKTGADVARILRALSQLFEYCGKQGWRFSGMTAAALS